jgi:hypothetical protein
MRSSQSAAAAVLLILAIAGCSNDDPVPAMPAPMQPPAPLSPGDTFGLTSANRIVTFNRAMPSVRTGVAISGLQNGEQLLGIDIRPGGTPAGELYALGSTGRIYTISTTSGAATQKAQLALTIDAAAGTLQLQNPPNDGVLTTIGRLDPALAFGATAGFDIVGGDDGMSLAVLQPTGAAQSTLYRVNLKTGAATVLGAIGPAGTAPLRGFAIRLQ